MKLAKDFGQLKFEAVYKLPYHVKYWELIKDYVIANVVLLAVSLENQDMK